MLAKDDTSATVLTQAAAIATGLLVKTEGRSNLFIRQRQDRRERRPTIAGDVSEHFNSRKAKHHQDVETLSAASEKKQEVSKRMGSAHPLL